jgi:acetyl-CoA acetyltransferase
MVKAGATVAWIVESEMPMPEAVIIDAVRTPGGKRNGKLSTWHPAALAAHVLDALVTRNGLAPALVDDVIMGCVLQVGEQSLNIARNAVLTGVGPSRCPPRRSIDNAVRASNACISRRRA